MQALGSFLHHLAASCGDGSFVRLALSSPVDGGAAVQRIQARLIELRGVPQLSFTLREVRRDTTQNVPLPEAIAWVERQLRAFRAAMLATTSADWQLHLPGSGEGKLVRHKPATTDAPPRGHDGDKPTFLGEQALPWLRGLGLVDDQGRPRARLAAKKVQIDRFVEILAHVLRDAGCAGAGRDAPPLRVVDVGCGKGHLTFAAWHCVKHVLARTPSVLGVEVREELLEHPRSLARDVAGAELVFQAGDIGHVPLAGADVLVALHACNTATDHAIRRGVEAGAKVILAAPCCHQEVRPQLGSPEPLAAVLRHGLFAERLAEWATDALRTLVLEHCGYRTKVVEFVSSEHTAKNLLLAGIRRDEGMAAAERAHSSAQIAAFREFFGIERHALDGLLAAAD